MSEVAQEAPEAPTEVPAVEPEAPAEPDVPFEEPDTAPEQPDEPEAAAVEHAAGLTERELEEIQKKLERSATTWRNRVSELLGEAAQMLVPCELCDPSIPGFRWPANVEQPRDELHAHLLDVLKNPAAPEYADSRVVRRCADCDGWGQVLSGSRVAGKERVVCSTCKGLGYQGPPQEAGQAAAPTNGEVIQYPSDTQPLTADDQDAWGSPRLLADGQENPNYGRAPSYKNPSLP